VIFSIRNPKYAFPFFHNDKAIRYNGQEGQVEVSNWRESRDKWFEENMDRWFGILEQYATSEDYEIGFFFNYDDFVRVDTGPQKLQELTDFLRSRGFNVAGNEIIPCLWYQSVGKDTIEHYIDYKYDFTDYVPMYTEEQQQDMLKRLSAAIATYGADGAHPNEKIVEILKVYYEDIRDDTHIDG